MACKLFVAALFLLNGFAMASLPSAPGQLKAPLLATSVLTEMPAAAPTNPNLVSHGGALDVSSLIEPATTVSLFLGWYALNVYYNIVNKVMIMDEVHGAGFDERSESCKWIVLKF